MVDGAPRMARSARNCCGIRCCVSRRVTRRGSSASQARRVQRWVMPDRDCTWCSSVRMAWANRPSIDAVQDRVADAFLTVQYQTFARSLLPNKPKASPHALPPRSKIPASFLKAAWWANCYTLGYLESIHPTLCRGGLAINHRYLIDAIVDPKRYRYSGPPRIALGDLVDRVQAGFDGLPRCAGGRDPGAQAGDDARRRRRVNVEGISRDGGEAAEREGGGHEPKPRARRSTQVTEMILGTMASRVARRFRGPMMNLPPALTWLQLFPARRCLRLRWQPAPPPQWMAQMLYKHAANGADACAQWSWRRGNRFMTWSTCRRATGIARDQLSGRDGQAAGGGGLRLRAAIRGPAEPEQRAVVHSAGFTRRSRRQGSAFTRRRGAVLT